MGWTERLQRLWRAMEDIEDPQGVELRNLRARLLQLEKRAVQEPHAGRQ